MSDEELVARTQEGDTEAFNELYLKYVKSVYGYLAVRVRNRQETEDLTAEVFIKAWKSFSSYQWQGTPVRAWLLRIAHNLLVDQYRKRQVVFEWLPANMAYTDRHFAWFENWDEIERALTSLSPEHQTILHLRYNEGREVDEIAGFLNKTSNAVRVAQHRALKQLRKAMEHAREQIQEERLWETHPASTG